MMIIHTVKVDSEWELECRETCFGDGEGLNTVVLDKNKKAILHLSLGELGKAGDLHEREGAMANEAFADLLRVSRVRATGRNE